jgi:hypothetical protein
MIEIIASGIVELDTENVRDGISRAWATNEKLKLTGNFGLFPVHVIAAVDYETLDIEINGALILFQPENHDIEKALQLIVLELADTKGKLIKIHGSYVLTRCTGFMAANEQSAFVRITRNHYRDPGNRCYLDKVEISGFEIRNRYSIGLAIAASSPFQWIGELKILNGKSYGEPLHPTGRMSIEYGSSAQQVLIDNFNGDTFADIQTETTQEHFPQFAAITNSHCGTMQFGGARYDLQNVEIVDCSTSFALDLIAGKFKIRGGKHKVREGGFAWQKASIDSEGVEYIFDASAMITISPALTDIATRIRLKKNRFNYVDEDLVGLADQMIKLTHNEFSALATIVLCENEFDKRCKSSIRAIGTSFVSINDKIAGNPAIRIGEFSRFGGLTVIHSDDVLNHKNVSGYPVEINATVNTANFAFVRSGNGWKKEINSGHSVLDKATFISVSEFLGEMLSGVEGDLKHMNGDTFEATKTSRVNAEWVER